MKNGERVDNRCLSCFMVKKFGYDSPKSNPWPLRRTLQVEVTLPRKCALTEQATDGVSTSPLSHT